MTGYVNSTARTVYSIERGSRPKQGMSKRESGYYIFIVVSIVQGEFLYGQFYNHSARKAASIQLNKNAKLSLTTQYMHFPISAPLAKSAM